MLVATSYSRQLGGGLDAPLSAEELHIDRHMDMAADFVGEPACLSSKRRRTHLLGTSPREGAELALALDQTLELPSASVEIKAPRQSALKRALSQLRKDKASLQVERASGGTSEVLIVSSGGTRIIFKPSDGPDEASALAAKNERAAFLLDRGWAGVPETALAELPVGPDGHMRTGSAQLFVDGEDASDYGANLHAVEDVHRIGVLDARILQRDRHAGNLVMTGKGLVPIDHALAFPIVSRGELAEVSSEVFRYPQAREPFSAETRAYIAALDAERDAETLEQAGMANDVLLAVWMGTTLLQRAAAKGKTLAQIGEMLERQGDRMQPSVLEEVFAAALADEQRDFFAAFVDGVDALLV